MKKNIRNAVVLLLFVTILVVLAPATAIQSNASVQNTAQPQDLSEGVQNIVKRARQMTQIQWTPKKDVTGWAGEVVYYADTTYTGLPYGQPVYADYIPWETTLAGFLEAVNDAESLMYTSQSTYNEIAPYYSTDCSAFVSWAWGLDSRQTTRSIHNFATKISESSYDEMEVGDCLCKAGLHVVLVTDITYHSNGSIAAVEISEATTSSIDFLCHSVWYGENYSQSLEQLKSKYLDSGYVLYRNKTRDSVTYTHSCAVPLEGDNCLLCGSGDLEKKPVSAEVYIAEETAIYQEPRSGAERIGTIYSNNRIQIKAYCVDGEGRIWYLTEYENWIMADNVAVERYLNSVSIINPSFPEGQLMFGAAFSINGNITSINPIINITARMGDQLISLDFDGIFAYSLQGSDIDKAMRFGRLADNQSYKFTLEVKELAYCGGDAQEEVLITAYSSDFWIGKPTGESSCLFTDVKESDYFFQPVLWAVEKGITSGTSATTFSPDQTCTRAQVVTFLWRASGKPAPVSDENPFTDVNPGDYFYDAVLWAVENGITSGTGNGKFSPNNPCTRDQVVTFLWRAMGNPAPEKTDNPFADVAEGVYYYEPVLWAVENGITSGTSATTFAPSNPCTRGQVVTFLYRAMKDK